jgi:methionyl-tRNA synthetase
MKKFYLTTPIYYVNSRPHLGHLYTTLVADTITRSKRQRGYDVFFLTGTDEHGVNIERAAEKRGVPVKQHVDEIVTEFQQMFPRFGLQYDHWIRTTHDYHYQGAQELWRRVRDAGYIYKGEYSGWYCPSCNEFLADGSQEQPICLIHERPAEFVSEESYFFKLSALQDRLLQYYEEHPAFVQPEIRRNEVLSFVKGGLHDLSVSRVSITWGIPVPDDPKHVMYVWFDALSNYITALGFGNTERQGFEKYWPADLQLVGKDILRQHTIYWPAFLMAAGLDLPRTVFAHGMWLSGGRKMSKTLGNVIDLNLLHKYFANDLVRYFCLREMVFGQDSDFTYGALIDRVNADLADGLGNLVSRTLAMVRKYCDGVIPDGHEPFIGPEELEIRAKAEEVRAVFLREFDQYHFSRALEAVWELIARVDKYISDNKPWALSKNPSGRKRLETLLNTATKTLRFLAALLAPVLPDAANQIWHQIGLDGTSGGIDPEALEFDAALSGVRLGEVSPVFPKIDKEKTMAEIEGKETQPAAAPAAKLEGEPAPERQYITIDDFAKIDMRTGTVLTARKVENADKLLLLTVDIGEGQPRQLLAGIAKEYNPEDIIGRQVIVVANLMPRKLRGYESNGMILAAAVGQEGRPVLASFVEDVPNGARLR